VEPAEALVERRAEPVDAGVVLEVERHQGRRAALRLDPVVERLEPADRAGEGNDMGAGSGERQRRGLADAARGAGDDRDAAGKGKGHAGQLMNGSGRAVRKATSEQADEFVNAEPRLADDR